MLHHFCINSQETHTNTQTHLVWEINRGGKGRKPAVRLERPRDAGKSCHLGNHTMPQGGPPVSPPWKGYRFLHWLIWGWGQRGFQTISHRAHRTNNNLSSCTRADVEINANFLPELYLQKSQYSFEYATQLSLWLFLNSFHCLLNELLLNIVCLLCIAFFFSKVVNVFC